MQWLRLEKMLGKKERKEVEKEGGRKGEMQEREKGKKEKSKESS